MDSHSIQGEKIRGQEYRNRQRSVSVHAKQSSMQPWVTGLWLGLAELFEEHSTTSITDTEHSMLINLLQVKQNWYWREHIADRKQYRYVTQELQSEHPQPSENFGANPEWYRWYEWNERDD